MKITFFGLTISSSWGNGHATLLRGLFKALSARGHHVAFFECDVPYYAAHRDFIEQPGVELHLYRDWNETVATARSIVAESDVAVVTSYCPDGIAASELVASSNVNLRVFYDLDTPVTLEAVQKREQLAYIGPRKLLDFDLILSYTGGAALTALEDQLGARRVVPLYGSVDPTIHHPAPPRSSYEADLSYLGTYAPDRQDLLEGLFLRVAQQLPERRFVLGGSKYPIDFPWQPNVWYVQHVPPAAHAAFFCSSPLTLNVTRAAMARMGYCPSGRLFEAAACGVAIVSDDWEGLETFFEPEVEIIVARSTNDVIEAMQLPHDELARIADAGRRRVLESHTATHRAIELENILNATRGLPAIGNLYQRQMVAEV
ncbi:MAG TPA: glycosyltransferase [Pyrinomonadaceae bacterium]|nr:glycosyltransferase [Pyrinomonadaceae bacterium]